MPLSGDEPVRLHFQTTERRPPWEPDSSALLLIHGLTCSSEQWFAQVDFFAPHYLVVTYDLRGHRRSSAPSSGYTIRDHIEDAIRLVSGLHLNRLNIIGSSVGGWIAQGLAAKLGDQVDSLVLVGTSSHTTDDIPFLLSQIDKLGAHEFLRQSFPKVMFSRHADPRVVQYVLEVALSIPPARLRKFFEESLEHDGDETAKALTCPTLVVVGDSDEISPLKYSLELRELIPNAFLNVIPSCGHFPHLEAPEVFNLLVHRFMTGHRRNKK